MPLLIPDNIMISFQDGFKPLQSGYVVLELHDANFEKTALNGINNLSTCIISTPLLHLCKSVASHQ
jgi:hypothetical protein